uniref:Uncharacterized protein n=1 Tax=Anopheles minimus TaxID=112268 RepID=A0A182WPA4_9DIPT
MYKLFVSAHDRMKRTGVRQKIRALQRFKPSYGPIRNKAVSRMSYTSDR